MLSEESNYSKHLNEAIELLILGNADVIYEFNGAETKETKALGSYVEGKLINHKSGRSLIIAYLPRNNNGIDVLMVHVGNLSKGTFTVEQYLMHKDLSYDKSSFNINNYNGSLATRIKDVLAFNMSIVNTALREVVLGNEWVDIPFDWDGYK